MIKVYLTVNPQFLNKKISCSERNKELATIKNEKVFNEKLQVWLFLEYALKKSGYQIEKLNFKKLPSGKWTAQGVEFSISHNNGVYAVAISNEPVGVDVQKHVNVNFDRIVKSIFSDAELIKFELLEEPDKSVYFFKKWAQKESLYKAYDKSDVTFKNLESLGYFTKTSEFVFNGDKFTLAVSCPTIKKIEYIVIDNFD